MTAASAKRNRILPSIFPFALGVITFFIVVGPRALNPLNIAWLETGDPATHYLGWLFYRNAPWKFPIGLNPAYGVNLNNSIVYSDSNPLLAFLFKPFSPILPTPFQYFGIWLLICFVLQAWFSWKLIGLVTSDALIRVLGAGFFVFAPPMIWRMSGHLSLAGHFLIVAALYLAFTPKLERRRLAWGGILVVAALVHGYLFAMVAAIWIADLCGNTLKKRLSIRNLIFEFVILIAAVGFTCWQAGYFSIGAGTASSGFGLYRMNLLSIFNPSGWSHVLGDIPQARGDYEGFNYLGLGVIFLLILALPIFISTRTETSRIIGKNMHLLLIFVGLTIFAASNNVGLGRLNYKYPLPDSVLQFANIFRASGRMFWPVFYAIVFSTIVLVIKGYGRRTATVVLALALIIQVADTSAGWSGIRRKLMTKPSSEWSTTLTDPFWVDAASRYKKIHYIPIQNPSPEWKILAPYAATHGLATDSVYLARVGSLEVENIQQKDSEELNTGKFEQDSLYVVNDAMLRKAAIATDRNLDLLARIDGLNIIAPGWKNCNYCHHVESEINPRNLFPSLQLGERLDFSKSNDGVNYLGAGWSTPEAWGTWSDGASATVFLPISPGQVSSIFIEVNALISPSHSKQRMDLSINGVPAASLTLTKPSTGFEVKLPEVVKQQRNVGSLKLEFHFPDAARPMDIGLGGDARTLAVGLVALTLR